jgi:hypothetical protein
VALDTFVLRTVCRQMDRVDPQYYARSTRLDIKEETRINATSDEAAKWVSEAHSSDGTSILNIVLDYSRILTSRRSPTEFYLGNILSELGFGPLWISANSWDV